MAYPASAGPAQPPVVAQPTTVVVISLEEKLRQQNVREWSTGICDCCADCCSCCYSFFCWCCFMCTLSTKLDEYYCGPCCCEMLFMIPMRTKTRIMYGITGSICKDLCCVMCCPCCAMTQIWRELEAMGPV